jgi:hypothetical protein
MSGSRRAKTANPYLSPRSMAEETATVAVAPLPWFCRIAFAWGCLVCLMAIAPEILSLTAWLATGSDPRLSGTWADPMTGASIVRWVFCFLGLAVNVLLLIGRRQGTWPAYLYLVLGAGLFMLVVFSIRAGTIPLGGTEADLGPKSATIALFAFLGGGSLGYYVLALHVYRNWLKDGANGRVS